MISYIRGKVVDIQPLQTIIEANGLGYEVFVPVTTAEILPKVGQEVTLHTFVAYREDSQTLYGFNTPEERDFFRTLVEKVSGIGPKIALSIMSKMTMDVLKQAIAEANVSLLSKCPGIGKKTAERLTVELKDRFSSELTASATSTTITTEKTIATDAAAALVELGMKPAAAEKCIEQAFKKLNGKAASTEELIKCALG